MAFDPHDITQDQLHAYRRAAEAAWGDDTRHPDYVGHPQPSAGQCYVTSRWLADKIGGHVAVKNGHYFTLTPDKKHVIDLTGDQFAYSPKDLSYAGIKLDEDDTGWQPHPEHHAKWVPGPVLYKPADHPLYKGCRLHPAREGDADFSDRSSVGKRRKLFAQRADEAHEQVA